MSWWNTALQTLQRGGQSVQQAGQRAIRIATQNPVARPVVEQYRRLPPSIRVAVNPLSNANIPLKPGPVLRTLGAGYAVDTLVENIAKAIPNKQLGADIGSAYLLTSLPVGGPLQRLAAAAALWPTPVNRGEEELMKQERARYEREAADTRDARARNQAQRTEPRSDTSARAGLSLPAPAEAAYAPPGPRQSPAATNPWPSPMDATARTSLPSQPTATAQTAPRVSPEILEQSSQFVAPTNVPLAQFYRAQDELGKKLGATELVRLMKETGRVEDMPEDALIKWATQNPGLAYREVLKGQI
jgi:hypothetical protein